LKGRNEAVNGHELAPNKHPPPHNLTKEKQVDVEVDELAGSLIHQLQVARASKGGVKFLYGLYKNNHGGVLGDDM